MNDVQKRSNEQTVKDDCQSNEGFVVKMHGLSLSTTADDIIKFLNTLGEAKVKDGASGVHFTMNRKGKPSSQAYVEMESEESLKAALKKDREYMGNRYIKVFPSKRSEMEWAIKITGSTLDNELYDNCVRIRGLPFDYTKNEIVEFFQGLEITPDDITIVINSKGRRMKEAFVQFVNRENLEKALQKHMEKIRFRYIEVFRSSLVEIRKSLKRRSRQTPYDRMDSFASSGGNSGGRGQYIDMSMRTERDMRSFGSGRSMGRPRGGSRGGASKNWNPSPSRPLHVVHMKGLPLKANKNDIAKFFEPLKPVNIHFIFNNNNQPYGEANVEFGNIEDAVQAMSKNKTFMEHRYIELFMVEGGSGSGGNNISMDDMGLSTAGDSRIFRGYGKKSFGGEGSINGFGNGNFFGNNTFSCRNDNAGPPNSFFSNNMGGGGYQRSFGPI
ncbi:heterogeneous nuclear ribonucleoprotein F-like [Acyrthosiphon pisum]|uniref:RRM domain-containing protein n=1 Tax=Acyrthosiphon pisum TaxID=7029 RepID=A0A8R2A829_ACYPI|nr:heterogeneous nuclear ribonucleoprotein F-like [Acyrthosiphon pisum]|eukprot:XP_001950119.1 PREDICTED: heterogeneous nuclear ribonucleoprotein F-like [Acyrthosiphon pisum]